MGRRWRTWLLYSVSKDSVFCFACKLFGKQDNALTKGGFRTWRNLAGHLKEHEYSKTHITCMTNWHELQMKLKTKTIIDQMNRDLMHLEMHHWRRSHTQSDCHNMPHSWKEPRFERAYKCGDPDNGNFLSQVELMEQFDPIMSKHLRRIHKEVRKQWCTTSAVKSKMKS